MPAPTTTPTTMPTYKVNTPSHNETVELDAYARDDRGDLKGYNETVDGPIVDVPVENFEGIYRTEWLV